MNGAEEAIVQNLKDAGCNPEMIQEFAAKVRKGNRREGIRLLELHRLPY